MSRHTPRGCIVVPAALAALLLGCGSTARDTHEPGSSVRGDARDGSGGAQDAARGASPEPLYARSHWHELDEDTGSSGEAWTIPYCETRSDDDGIALRPAGPAARDYSPRSQQTGPHGGGSDEASDDTGLEAPEDTLAIPLHHALYSKAGEIATAEGTATLHHDPILAAAAADLVRMVPDDHRIPFPMLEFAVRHHGAIPASPTALVLWGPLFDPPALARQLAIELPAVLAAAPAVARYNRIGIASVERGETGAGVVVLVLAAQYATTRPFPRALPRGGVFTIEGELAAPFRAPEVTVIRDAGDRMAPTVIRTGSRGFRVEVPCGSFRGRQRIHLAARPGASAGSSAGAGQTSAGAASAGARGGLRTLASVPVWCHGEPPISIAIPRRPGEQTPLATIPSTREIAIRLALRINAERRRCGLDDIAVDPAIDRVADARPASAPVARQRLIASGLQTSSVYQFKARAFDIDEVVRELFESFDYRAALLSPRTTHMGLGIARARAGKGSEYFVTQLFASVPGALTLTDVRQAVVARLQRRRGLLADSELALQAERTARELAAGIGVETAVDRATRDLRRKRTRFMTARIQVWNGADVGDFRLTREARDREVRHFGLGVARSSDQGERAGEFTVVLILGEEKEGQVESGSSLGHP